MKKISVVMVTGILFALHAVPAIAQESGSLRATSIEPYHLSIAFNKTTNLIFPYSIKSVDKGSRDVLAQKAKGVENILLVKAGKENFEETNLTVVTTDGQLYSYILDYASNPSVLNLQFPAVKNNESRVAYSSQAIPNEALIQDNARKVVSKKRILYGVYNRKHGIELSLSGLYIKDDVMYYQLKIENSSNISYDIDNLRFFIRDDKKSERTASQEIELKPLSTDPKVDKILDHSEQVLVFALAKITIPDKKYLAIQLMEREGGRHLSLSIKNGVLVKAKFIM